MKNLVFLLLLLITSCGGSDDVTISQEEYDKLKGVRKSEYPKPYEIYDNDHTWDIVLGEDGHEFLENDSYHAYVFIHFPSCKKCNQDSIK